MELLLQHRPQEAPRSRSQDKPLFVRPPWDPEPEVEDHAEEMGRKGFTAALTEWWESNFRSEAEAIERRERERAEREAERERKAERRRQQRLAEAAEALAVPVEVVDWGQETNRSARSVMQSVISSWSAAVLGTGQGLESARDAAGSAATAAASNLPFLSKGSADLEEGEEEVEVAQAPAVDAEAPPGDEEAPSVDWIESARGALLGPFQGVADDTADDAAVAGDDTEAKGSPVVAAVADGLPSAANTPAAAAASGAPPAPEVTPPLVEQVAEECEDSTPVVERQPEADVEPVEVPAPVVPGMEEANLIVTVAVEPQLAEAVETLEEGIERLMSQRGGDILAMMAQDGWEVKPVDEDRGLYEILLPSVNYKVAGATVSIPSPRFLATCRDTFDVRGGIKQRLQGDLVLQNGKDIVTVELGFPFGSKFSISAAGWTRAGIGSQGGSVAVSNNIEIGLQIPRVPGLEGIMQYFVKSYGTVSTVQVAEALASGADTLPPDLYSQFVNTAKGAMSSLTLPRLPTMGSDEESGAVATDAVDDASEKEGAVEPLPSASRTTPSVPPSAIQEKIPVADDTVDDAAVAGDDTEAKGSPVVAAVADGLPSVASTPAAAAASGAPPAREVTPPPVEQVAQEGEDSSAVVERQPEADVEPVEVPAPVVPGMEEANLFVTVAVEPQLAEAVETLEEGIERLMSQRGGDILALMGQDGWEIKPVDEDRGLYEILLPSVDVKVAGATVSIPSPRFLATCRDTFDVRGGIKQRLQGDLVLQNGKDIVTVELGFPFGSKFSISAAGWTRANIGSQGSSVTVSNDIEIGLQIPRVPGLESIMQYFVKSYGTTSTVQVAEALALGADTLPPDLYSQFLNTAKGAMSSLTLPSLPTMGPDAESGASATEAVGDASERRDAARDVGKEPADGEEDEAKEEFGRALKEEVDAVLASQSMSPTPAVPGLDDGEKIVMMAFSNGPVTCEATKAGEEGVACLMARSGIDIVSSMDQGWEIKVVDETEGTYEMLLPAVELETPVAIVSIQRPRFLVTVRETLAASGSYQERLQGDMVLQNGKDIMTIQLKIPGGTSFAISAAGWTRTRIGWREACIVVSNDVQMGLFIPRVFPVDVFPQGFEPVMRYFFESYGDASATQIAESLAAGADKLPPEAISVNNLVQSAKSAMSGLPKLQGFEMDSAKMHMSPKMHMQAQETARTREEATDYAGGTEVAAPAKQQ